MIKYQRNNILFRISSASAIAKFKNEQAAAFLQLIRQELYFDNSAKEIVLIEYDRISQWIFRIERLFLAHGESYLPPKFQEAIIASFIDELYIIEKIIETHPVVFRPEILEYIKIIHEYAKPTIQDQLNRSLSKNYCSSAFEQMLLRLETYLQHILLAMYEINNNLYAKTKKPFICVTNFCTANTLNHNNELVPALTRLAYFKTKTELTNEIFEVKNYTNTFDNDSLEDIFIHYGDKIAMEVREKH